MGEEIIGTAIIKSNGDKLENIGRPGNLEDLAGYDSSDGPKLWLWYMDFVPVVFNKNYIFFVMRGGGANCAINAKFVGFFF